MSQTAIHWSEKLRAIIQAAEEGQEFDLNRDEIVRLTMLSAHYHNQGTNMQIGEGELALIDKTYAEVM